MANYISSDISRNTRFIIYFIEVRYYTMTNENKLKGKDLINIFIHLITRKVLRDHIKKQRQLDA